MAWSLTIVFLGALLFTAFLVWMVTSQTYDQAMAQERASWKQERREYEQRRDALKEEIRKLRRALKKWDEWKEKQERQKTEVDQVLQIRRERDAEIEEAFRVGASPDVKLEQIEFIWRKYKERSDGRKQITHRTT